MRHKIIFICIALLLFVSMMPATHAESGDQDVFILRESTTAVKVNEEWNVTVAVTNLTDLYGYEIKLAYNADVLEWVRGEDHQEGFQWSPKIENNSIMLIHTKKGQKVGLTGDHDLYTLVFKAKGEGTANVAITGVKMTDSGTAAVGKTGVPGSKVEAVVTARNTEPAVIPVTGVTLNHVSAQLFVGNTLQLTASIEPHNATNQALTWNSSNETVASVDSQGKVTAKSAGRTTITVTSADGQKKAECTVTVTTSSSGGGYQNPSPSPSPKPSTEKTSVQVEGTVDSQGVATAHVSEKAFKEAVANADNASLKIEVVKADSAQVVRIQIPVELIQYAKDNGITVINLITGLAQASLQSELVTNEKGILEFSVAKVNHDSLTAEQVVQLEKSAIVLRFDLTVNGKKVEKFTGGSVKLSIPYSLKQSVNPDNIIIYDASSTGTLDIVKNGKYNASTGTIEFKPKHFGKYTAAYVSNTFQDIARLSWAQTSIEALAARDIVNGFGGGAFAPEKTVTRAEFITMLVRMSGLAEKNTQANFTDVKEDDWFYQPVTTARMLGIVEGKKDGSFGVNEPISRQDMVVMASRMLNLFSDTWLKNSNASSGTEAFADYENVADYAKVAVSNAQNAGLIEGYNGQFSPKDPSTRAQSSVIIYRIYNILRDLPGYTE